MAMEIRESQGLTPAVVQPRCWAEPRTSLDAGLGGWGWFGVSGQVHLISSSAFAQQVPTLTAENERAARAAGAT